MRGNKIQRKSGKGMALLTFFIGIIFGIIVVLGALGGGAYFLLSGNLDSVLGAFGLNNSDENGDKYINTDPDDGGVSNLLELISRIAGMAGDYKNLTLGQIDDLIPATRGLADSIIDSISKYVTVDYSELREVKFSELGGYIEEVVMGELDKMLVLELITGSENPDELLSELFGDLTLGDFVNGNVDVRQKIDNIEITLVIDVRADEAVMSYLGYGITGITHDETADVWTAKLKLEDGSVADCFLSVGKDGKINDVYYMADGEVVYVQGTTIGEIISRISGITDDLTIGEIVDISDDNSIILNVIKNSTINNIGKTIDALTFNELYADEIYRHVVYVDSDGDGQADKIGGNPVIDEEKSTGAKLRIAVPSIADIPVDADPDDYIIFHRGYIYYRYVDGVLKLVNMDDDGENKGKLTAEQFGDGKVEADFVYYTYGAPNSMWKLLLAERVQDGSGRYMDEKVLSLDNIGDIVANISAKLSGSTLRELDEAGILDFKTSDLEIVVNDGGTPDDESDDVKLGDLELGDALSELVNLLKLINSAP